MKLPKDFHTIIDPYKFQKETIGLGIVMPNPGILLPMGTGKTYCAINIARYHLQKDFNKILVVCPSPIIFKWDEEIRKFSEFKSTPLHSLSGNITRDERIMRLKDDSQFFIINYEFLHKITKELSELNPDMIIFDESSRYIKNAEAKRTMSAIILSDLAKKRSILTGTLIANKPIDLWSQFRCLDGGKTFGRNFYAWRNYFFEYEKLGAFGRWNLRKDKIPSLNAAVKDNCIIMKKEDCLPHLPDKVFDMTKIEMGRGLKKIYGDVKRKVLAEIETEEGETSLNMKSILEKFIRLQQITSGFTVKNEAPVLLRERPKIDAIMEDVESIAQENESAIVWCRFLFSLDNLSKMISSKGINIITMSGRDSPRRKYDKWRTFQKRKDINIFCGQIESGGIGIDLFKEESTPNESQYMLFFENGDSLDTRLQAIDRIHRSGQKSKCMYRDYLVLDTIDEKRFRSIIEKKDVADSIIKHGVKEMI